MKKHSIKELIILILMFFLAMNGFSKTVNEPCLTVSKVKIVVIGSEINAADIQDKEPMWIKKYRSYLRSFNSDNEIINLTRNGINSYQIVPTRSTSPYGRPKADPAYNISKAISLKPDAIIVNLEYNDILENFQANEQIINIMLIASEANRENIPIWVNTPKPLINNSNIQTKDVIKIKDLIKQRFNPFVVNFWDDLADDKGTIKNELLNEDGVTFNDNGQKKMLEKLVAADIHQYCARRKYKGGKDVAIYSLVAKKQENQTQKFEVTIANSGNEIEEEINIKLDLVDQVSNDTISLTKTIKNGLESCQFRSIEFSVNELPIGNYDVAAYIAKRIDRNPTNDTTKMIFKQVAFLAPVNKDNDKIQVDNKVELYAINIDGFSSNFNRYNQAEDYTFSNGGEAKVYSIADIFNEDNIASTTFKILADKSMEISAFEVEVENPGAKLVEVFYKRNVDTQKDNSLSYWHLASSQEILVEKGNSQIEILTKDIILRRNDNVGIYIRTKDLSGLPVSRNK